MKRFALVTASTKGIGRAIGEMLLKKGYFVFFNYAHDESSAIRLSEELGDFSEDSFAIIKADLSDYSGIDILLNAIRKHTTTLDCVVLNAGATCYKEFQEININDWEYVLKTNISTPFFLLQKVDHLFQDGGKIIFIGAHMGIVPHGRSIAYSVSKAAATMLSQSLVKVYKNRNITVNSIAPGFIETEWHNNKKPDHISRIKNKIAVGRFGKPEEVASLCQQIIENDYINGSVMQIHGGYDME